MPIKKVVLAKPRGFCAGVDRAIDVVNMALQLYGSPVYVRKEIVHNKYVIRSLAAKGAVFIDELDEVPDGAVAIFSAHGVSPQVRATAAAKNLKVIDATCPLVTKVHMEAVRYANEEPLHHPGWSRRPRRSDRHHGGSPGPDSTGGQHRGGGKSAGSRP